MEKTLSVPRIPGVNREGVDVHLRKHGVEVHERALVAESKAYAARTGDCSLRAGVASRSIAAGCVRSEIPANHVGTQHQDVSALDVIGLAGSYQMGACEYSG